jgi:hypothetical protein
MSEQIEQENIIEQLAGALLAQLKELNQTLRRMEAANNPSPEYRVPIEQYPEFNWTKLGARVVAQDEWGATIVSWNGKQFKRRSPDNKYGACIWFSRVLRKAESVEKATESSSDRDYAILIRFETVDTQVDPLGDKAKAALQRAQRKTSAVANTFK